MASCEWWNSKDGKEDLYSLTPTYNLSMKLLILILGLLMSLVSLD